MKKIFLTFIFFITATLLFAVDNIFDGSTDANWGTAANWSQNAVPTASDGYVTVFDATSPNCTVNASNRVCNSINFTGYTNTITMSYNITVSGSITLEGTMHVSGGGILVAGATGTLTSDAYSFPNTFRITGNAQTFTFSDNWTVYKFENGTTTGTSIINGSTIYCTDFDAAITGAVSLTGTTAIVVSGTWSSTSTTAILKTNSLTLLTGATISGAVYFGSPTAGATTLTVAAGATITTTGSTLQVMSGSTGATTTLNLNGLSLYNFKIQPQTTVIASTITLASGLIVTGTFNYGNCYAQNAMNSSVGGTKRTFTMSPTSTIKSNLNYTDIDASAGKTIWSYDATISNCDNIKVLVPPITTSHVFAY